MKRRRFTRRRKIAVAVVAVMAAELGAAIVDVVADQYPTERASLRVTPAGARTRGREPAMTFANRTPPGQSQFIAGPFPGLGTTYGEDWGSPP